MRASPLVLDRSFEILPPGPDAFGRLRGQLFGRWPVSTGGPGATAVLRPGRGPVADRHAGRNSSAAWHGGDAGRQRAMLPWRERHEMDWLSFGVPRARSDSPSGKAAILQMRFARMHRTAFRAFRGSAARRRCIPSCLECSLCPRIRGARGRPLLPCTGGIGSMAPRSSRWRRARRSSGLCKTRRLPSFQGMALPF